MVYSVENEFNRVRSAQEAASAELRTWAQTGAGAVATIRGRGARSAGLETKESDSMADLEGFRPGVPIRFPADLEHAGVLKEKAGTRRTQGTLSRYKGQSATGEEFRPGPEPLGRQDMRRGR